MKAFLISKSKIFCSTGSPRNGCGLKKKKKYPFTVKRKKNGSSFNMGASERLNFILPDKIIWSGTNGKLFFVKVSGLINTPKYHFSLHIFSGISVFLTLYIL